MSDANRPQPDWERFGRAIMAGWPNTCDFDCFEVQDLAERCGVLLKVQFDPEKHACEASEYYGVQPGDRWFVPNYEHRRQEDE